MIKLHTIFKIADRTLCLTVSILAMFITLANYYLHRWGVAIPMTFGLVFLIWIMAHRFGYIPTRHNRHNSRIDNFQSKIR